MADERTSDAAVAGAAGGEPGLFARALRAVEVLVSAHVSLARVEAKADLARILSGVALLVMAIALATLACAIGHVALVLVLEAQLACGYETALAAVAATDAALATVLMLLARARLAAPVLVETRSMLTKAAVTLRG
ncbi:MAG: phage holin family protein [Deltaproteobacteria bacterium]|nr:phage holin family protein [Deltaproteobacteria bacterium]